MKTFLPGKMDTADQDWAIALTVAFLAIGVAFAALVPRGLPYDEPSHFNIVQLNSQLQGLPVMGRPGVTYEACQPPLYYFLAGLLYRGIISMGLVPLVAFYVCRAATLLVACPLVYFTYRMARELSGRRTVARCAALLVAMNPGILAICSSIQNDSLAFLFATLASYLCIRWCLARSLSIGKIITLSALAAAAIMSKSSALPLVPFIAIMLCIYDPRRCILWLLLFAAILAAATGWWFIRNQHLYGDWSGGRSVDTVFGAGHRFNPTSPKDWRWVVQSFITYHTTPVTYWRDQFKNPRWYTLAIGAETLCIACVFAISLAKKRLTRLTPSPAIFTLLCIAFWLFISYRNFAVAARIAMPALAATMLLIAWALADFRAIVAQLPAGKYFARAVFPVLAIVFLAADINLLRSASRQTHRPYEINPQVAPLS